MTFPGLVEVAFLRIVTHPGIFRTPSSLTQALTQQVRLRWRHWCRELDLRGNDVNDAFLAACAAESGCRLVTRDNGFKRFGGLAWWNPLQPD